MNHKGLLVVVCGPSGVGKGTICREIVGRNENVYVSISATTRKPRKGETDGVHYYYKTEQEFENMIESDELLEWAKYCKNYYGTPKTSIETMLDDGKDVILEIDVQGALQVKRNFPDGILIFILPPSLNELKDRIVGRGTESDDVIHARLLAAKGELKHVNEYDYIIVNDKLHHAVSSLESIITAEKCRLKRNIQTVERMCGDDIPSDW